MTRSMTGQGQARQNGPNGLLSVEIRTVNNRGLKIVPRVSEPLACFEPQIEAVLRSHVHRGSVQLKVRLDRSDSGSAYSINSKQLLSYCQQLEQVRSEFDGSLAPLDLARIAQFPGVLNEADDQGKHDEGVWKSVQEVLCEAIENLNRMRDEEGSAMQEALLQDLAVIETHLASIAARRPDVVSAYRDRLESKVDTYLAEKGLVVAQVEILREIQLFADRSDISEEVTRLDAHHKAFEKHLKASGANGRKLDFVIQEMGRETNTIGSKASDSQISADVVEIKCALERMRELIQNIE